ncbi:MAG: hypothetical protein LBV79_02220 [Candidatus Adiutrix sp.]|jgi:hypothetical protein|nr:hypothetical protein [Candidatus Adiutrix sp.]
MNDSQKPDDRDSIDMNDREAAPAQSQAVLDIQEAGLTPEEAVAASKSRADAGKKSKRPEKLAAVAGFRWLVLLILSLAGVAVWAADSQFFSLRPYAMTAWGVLGLSLLVGLLSYKLLRLPTRAGLAALAWSASFFIDALYGPSQTILNGAAGVGGVPAVLPWAGLLALIFIWVLVAIWRKLGRYKAIDVILGIVLLYAAVGSLWGILGAFAGGGATGLTFAALTTSPLIITESLPWALWPMTVMLFFILPLAALLALGDQLSAFKRKGRRHGGNFFLALAFILLLPYGFLTYDRATTEVPALGTAANSLRAALGISGPEEIIVVYASKPAVPAATAETGLSSETAAPVDIPTAPADEITASPLQITATPPVVTVTTQETPTTTVTVPATLLPAEETPAAAQVVTPPPVAPAPVVTISAQPTPVTAPAQANPFTMAPPSPAAAPAPKLDPAVLRALASRLEDTEEDLQRAIIRLEKAESGLAEALKKIEALEQQLQQSPASPASPSSEHSDEAPPQDVEIIQDQPA